VADRAIGETAGAAKRGVIARTISGTQRSSRDPRPTAPRIRLHAVARHQRIRIAIVRQRTGLPADDVVQVRADAVVAVPGGVAGAAEVVEDWSHEELPLRFAALVSATIGRASETVT
jgi:hypothetical protein